MSENAGPPPPLENAIDRLMRLIERVLALLFIAAVSLNFINVVGRYVVGRTLLSADELQIFAMILMTFIGFIVVTWRRQHLRMDVLVEACPGPFRLLIRAFEWMVFVSICAFVVYQSSIYIFLMFSVGRTSDMAGIPMWIPHAAIAAGFASTLAVLLYQGWSVLGQYLRQAHRPDTGGDAQ
jgi:TRAP-type C4-dicarboxylate transport system permease small subunit